MSTSGHDQYGKTYEPSSVGSSTAGTSGSGSGSSSIGGAGMSSTSGSSTGMSSYSDGKMSDQDQKQQHAEGTVAKTIEQQTAKIPSDVFLWAAFGSMGISAALHFAGSKDQSRFVGQWVAPLLLFGVYNKIVKTQGSDRTEQ